MARILIADDEPDILELIKNILAPKGHRIDGAYDGEEAWSLLKKNRYDLAILDRSMPRMSGLQLLAKIRAAPATKALKVMICTSHGLMKQVEEAMSAGADDYVTKPFDLTRLAQKVEKHLSTLGPT